MTNTTPIIEKTKSSADVKAILCALAAVSIWGWWMSATRVAATGGVAPIDVAFLRYLVPAILLIPVWLATFRKIRTASKWALLAMLGWGAPFLWLVTASLENANVIYLATIMPCTMPVFAFLAEKVFFNFKPSSKHWIGFTLIGLAALIVIVHALSGSDGIDIKSLIMMLLASLGWASYVVSFKHTGLSATQGAAWVCIASTLIIVAIKLVSGGPFLPLTFEQIVFNGIAQGFISGFVAVILYTIAIARLGSARAASFSVLVPIFGAAFAWAWLGEQPLWIDMAALVLGSLGVAVVNGVVRLPYFQTR
jgi:drug/metabolite transporter (DMT)-like permease